MSTNNDLAFKAGEKVQINEDSFEVVENHGLFGLVKYLSGKKEGVFSVYWSVFGTPFRRLEIK